jgi:hypothetical protein
MAPSAVQTGKVFSPPESSYAGIHLSEGAVVGMAKAVLTSVLVLVAVLSVFAAPVKALDRSEGNHWVYEGGMDFEGIEVSGGMTYEFVEADTLTVGSESYEVNVLKVTGSLSGATDDFMGITASVEVVIDGFTYEVAGSLASVKEDMHMWANMTIGTGSFALVTRMETHDVTTYSPAMLSGFVEGETGTGDEWDETVNVSSTSTTWVDGDVDDPVTDEHTETYSYSIAATEESVTTDAGTFSCLKMTETDSEGDYTIYWYSSDVGSWVKLSMFTMGESTPYMSLELTEYSYSADSDIMVLLPWIIGIVAAVVVIAVVLMVMRKRGRSPAQMAVAPEEPPPPPSP